jgi:signal transduction histidine kinase
MPHRPAPFPLDEARRIAALEHFEILDSEQEQAFDDIVQLATALCQVPIALVSLVDRERQWFKACIGLDVAETHRDLAFCAHAILEPDSLLIVEDATLDPRFQESPLVLGPPFIRFYAGAPIITEGGHALGTVCVIDTVARTLSAVQYQALQALARQTAALVQLRLLNEQQAEQTRILSRQIIEALADDEDQHAPLRQKQRVASLGQLTSGIAHDFNNLLQSISVSFQLIERKYRQPDDVLRWATMGLQAVTKGASLIAHLLAFSRDAAPDLHPLDIGTRIDSMRDLLCRVLGPKVQLDFVFYPIPLKVLCDATQLEAAMLNLLINARDAMGDIGQIRVSTHSLNLKGDAELPDGRYLELCVSDSGPGISADVAARVFEPFFTTKKDGKGTGLGLAQVYGFALKAGGIARVQSEPGKGTTLQLLLKIVDDEPSLISAETDPAQPARAKAHAHILLVDDDLLIRSSLGELLADSGYDVSTASTSSAAMQIIEQRPPDLVVTDYAMQGFSGADLARMLREVMPDLPIVFMTGDADLDSVREKIGATAPLLQKPVLLEELVATMQGVLT